MAMTMMFRAGRSTAQKVQTPCLEKFCPGCMLCLASYSSYILQVEGIWLPGDDQVLVKVCGWHVVLLLEKGQVSWRMSGSMHQLA